MLGEVIATLGYFPVVAASVLAERNFDAADHQKRSVIKRARSVFPGKDAAARFVASRIHGYGSKVRPCLTISDAKGESFFAAVKGQTFGPDVFGQLEDGGGVSSSKGMIIPFKRLSAFQRRAWGGKSFNPKLAGRLFTLKSGLVIAELPGRGKGGVGAKTVLVGWRANQRQQPAMLGFGETWENKVQPKMLGKLERDLERVMTVAGQEAVASELAAKDRTRADRGRAFTEAYQGFLKSNPRNRPGAVRAALAAAKSVKADPIGERGRA